MKINKLQSAPNSYKDRIKVTFSGFLLNAQLCTNYCGATKKKRRAFPNFNKLTVPEAKQNKKVSV